MPSILSIRDLSKAYDGGFRALDGVDLEIEEGEIIALLGPNGAGKTTLISTICGISRPTSGTINVGGFDIQTDYRKARAMIGLVPQEITLEPFQKVADAVRFSRGLFGKRADEDKVDAVLKSLSLDDKKDVITMALSGGMRRRVLIAKALAHEPKILFLDEPTAGVDVALRKDMWTVIEALRRAGTTIILTTHYIEEAEAIADRIAVINKGKILLVEKTSDLMARLGQKELRVILSEPLSQLPKGLDAFDLSLSDDGSAISYLYDVKAERTGITALLSELQKVGLQMADLETRQSSLEEIFVDLVGDEA